MALSGGIAVFSRTMNIRDEPAKGKWALHKDKWPLNNDEWPLSKDKWRLKEEWPLSKVEWPLKNEEWPLNQNKSAQQFAGMLFHRVDALNAAQNTRMHHLQADTVTTHALHVLKPLWVGMKVLGVFPILRTQQGKCRHSLRSS